MRVDAFKVFLFFISAIFVLPIAFCGITGIDVWSHLREGALIFAKGAPLYTDSLTVLSDGRKLVDYSWGFQVLIYFIYKYTGFWGLIVFKAIIAFITFLLIYGVIVRKGCSNSVLAFTASLIVFVVYANQLSDVSPYLITYLNVVLIMLIFSTSNRKLWWCIPFIQILQANFHGMMSVFTLMLIFFYTLTAEVHVKKWYISVLSLFATFVNPYHYHILTLPFSFSPREVSHYISEFAPIPLKEVFNLYPSSDALSLFAFKVILWSGVLVFFLDWKRVKFHELFLFIVMIFVSMSMIRFSVGFALVVAPYISRHLYMLLDDLSEPRRFVFSTFVLVSAIILWVSLWKFYSKAGVLGVPVVEEFYPTGCVNFMKSMKMRGSVFNNPNYGGIIEWYLYPDVKPYIDPRIPTLFTKDEYWLIREASYDIDTVRKFVVKFDYILWTRESGFSKFIHSEVDEFVPVYFDTHGILFVNKKKHPEFADRYEMKKLRPFEDPKSYIPGMTYAYLVKLVQEGIDMLKYWDKNEILIETLLLAFINTEDYGMSLRLIEEVLKTLPYEYKFRYYLAYINYLMGSVEEAIKVLKTVIKKRKNFPPAYYLLGKIYYEQGEVKDALKYLREYQRLNSFELTVNEWILVGNTYFQLDKYESALNCYLRALYFDKSRENTHIILNNIGNVYFQIKDYEQALFYYRSALKEKSNFTDALINIGIVYKEIGDEEGMIEVLNMVDKIGGVPPSQMRYLQEMLPSSRE